LAKEKILFGVTMPMELQIIRAQEFIRLGPKGHFDLRTSKAVLANLARACCQRGINQALLDLRALHPGPKPVFSPNDLVTLVNTFREVGFTHQQRLAVLYGDDPHHRARLFAFIAKLRGWSVQAFDNFEQAMLWLSRADGQTAESEFTPTPKKVPVHKLKTLQATAKPAPVIKIKSVTGRKSTAIPARSGNKTTRAAAPAARVSPWRQ
jgi:hypothetical protein